MTRRLLVLLAALSLSLSACKTAEQKLVDKRRALRTSLDALYAEYGGGGPAKDPQPGLVGRFVAEVDRSYFEQHCLAMGRGERVFNVSGKLQAFLEEPSNARVCRDAADLELEIAALERQVGGR